MLNYLKRTTNNFFERVHVYCGEMLKSKTVEGELCGPTIAINGAVSGTVPLDNGQQVLLGSTVPKCAIHPKLHPKFCTYL